MNSKEENSSIENEKKVEKNISDIKNNLSDIDLSTEEYFKINKKHTSNFDALSSNKQSFIKRLFHRIKIFFIKKEVWPKSKKLMHTLFKKFKWNKLFALINKYKVLYYRAYIIIVTIFIFLCIILVCKIVIESKVNSGYQKLIEIQEMRMLLKNLLMIQLMILEYHLCYFILFHLFLLKK